MDIITQLVYCRSLNRLHFCFIVSYLIISSFSFSLFKHYFLPLFLDFLHSILLVLFSDLKNRYKFKTIFEMLIHLDL